MASEQKNLSEVEGIKSRSNFLRGTLKESLLDPITGAIAPDDTQLSKFHGLYQQDDRDLRSERAKQKLEPLYSFMIRARVPGGVCTPDQWLGIDELATRFGGGAARLTTRQAFQLHGVVKEDLKGTMRAIHNNLMDTIAACGDVNRNVMCSPVAETSPVHAEAYQWAARISELLTPHTRAYAEIWLDGEKVSTTDSEPIYGPTYLPRKFKIAMAIPPLNDVDVLAHDFGLIAIVENGKLAGFNVTVGGGMGRSHGEPNTYPRLANVIGFCTPEQTLAVAEHVVGVQRDFGNRENRKRARLKYTIDDRSVEWFIEELQSRLGFSLEPARRFRFTRRGDDLGWSEDTDGKHYLTLFVPSGRVHDSGERRFLSGLRAVAKLGAGEFRLTANQNLIVAGLTREERDKVDALIVEHGIDLWRALPPIGRDAMACVAMPSCSLAMAEAERFLPELVDEVHALLAKHGVGDEPVSLRMTGCPNGCARPYVAEIALIGKAPGRYNLMLGGDALGQRLNTMYRENLAVAEILAELDTLIGRFALERRPGEPLGDYLSRTLPEEAA